MRWIKVVAALLLIIGIGLIGSSMYIMKQVDLGQAQIENAEKKVQQGKQLFSIVPETQGIGKQLMGSADKKINSGKDLIAQYQKLASQLKYGGIIVSVVGVCLFFVGNKKKR